MSRLKRFAPLIVVVIINLFVVGTVFAAPQPSVTLSGAGEVPIGEDFSVTLTFDNTDATDTGYGPFIDVVLPTNGADGAANTSLPLDGITFNGASYLGSALDASLITLQTFPDTPLGVAPCGVSQTQLTHPLLFDTSGNQKVVCGTPGDQFITLELPFGSFTPDQPPADIVLDLSLNNYADLNTPLGINYRSGFQYGADPLQNPCCDPVIEDFPTENSPAWPTEDVLPILINGNKVINEAETEITNGPNDPSSWTIEIDIPDGQTVTDVDVFDYIPNNVIVTGIGGFTPAGTIVDLGGNPVAFPYGPVPADGVQNELQVNFASITGTTAPVDASFTIDYYVGYADAGGGAVIDPVSGADAIAENRFRVVGDWTPLDPRDTGSTDNAIYNGTCPSCPPDTENQIEPLAIQKSGSTGEAVPGDVVTYTLNIQVSDFIALDNMIITDVIGDGQRLNSVPTISFTQHGGSFANAVNGANYEERQYFTGGATGPGGLPDPDAPGAVAGDTVLYIDVAQEVLDELGNNEILGGCVPAGGTGGPTPDCGTFNGGQTTITITYDTLVQDEYTDNFPSGDPSVDQGDVLGNNVDTFADVLSFDNLNPTGGTTTDDSSASVLVPRGDVVKEIYAINGSTSFVPEVRPGDTVTYRVQYELTTTDFENLQIIDYPPLPVLDATTITTFNTGIAGSGTAPAVGEATYGPNDSFFGFTGITPAITSDAVANSVTFDFGSFDNPGATATTLDLLMTFEVSNDPFADGLFLTNQAEVTEGTTQNEVSSVSSIVQIVLREPAIFDVQKGVRSTTNPGANITEDDSTIDSPYGSDDFVNDPIDSDVSGVDGGDFVTFSIALQNEGGAAAYDIVISDVVQPGFILPTNPADLNIIAERGDGTSIGVRFLGGNNNEYDLFRNATAAGAGADGNGIELIDPEESSPGAGGICQPAHPSDGSNIVIITYTLQIDPNVPAPTTIENTAFVEDYSNSEGGPSFIEDGSEPSDSAITEVTTPSITKDIAITSEDWTPDIPPYEVLIGEIVRYRLDVALPEAGYTNLQVIDLLPDGMQFVADGTAEYSFVSDSGISSTAQTVAGCTAGTFCGFAAGTVTSAGGNGDDITFNFGDVNNVDDDANTERILIEFNALVLNVVGNQAGTTFDNSAELRVNGNLRDTSDVSEVTVVEPDLSTTKEQREGSLSGPQFTEGDAGDTFVYRIFITNNGNAPAYDVIVTDALPLDYVEVNGAISTTGPSPAGATGSSPGGANIVNNPTPGPFQFRWDRIDPGVTVSVNIDMRIRDAVAPGESWINTADVTYTSLFGDNGNTGNGTGSDNTGTPGSQTGERTGDDGAGGALNDYFVSDDTPTLSVPLPQVNKHVEYPLDSPVADFFGGSYTDSTTDPDTGDSLYNPGWPDVTIGEEFNFIVTVTFNEGTTYEFIMIDLLSPIGHNGGRQFTALEMLSAEVIHVGGNLSGGGIQPVGTLFTIVDSNGDGDGTRSQLFIGGVRDVLNTPDNVVNDDDRYVIRIRARVDDEDESGASPPDDLIGIGNDDGDRAGNRLQYQWNDQDGNTSFSNVVSTVDIVEPNMAMNKSITAVSNPSATITGGNASGVEIGDTLTYTLTLNNNGNAPAYDISGSDELPNDGGGTNYAIFDALDAAASTCDDRTGWTFTGGTPTSTYAFDDLLTGESCTIVYTATVTSDVINGEVYINTAEITEYSSRPGTPPDNRIYDPVTGTANYTVQVTLPTKEIAGTSETHTSDTEDGTSGNERPVAIGEVITYRLATTIPQAQVDGLEMVDILAEGVEYIPGSATISYLATSSITFADANFNVVQNEAVPTTTFPAANLTYDNVTRELTFTIGSVTNNDTDVDEEFIIIDFDVVVVNDVVTNDTNGNGVNDLGDLWSNTFETFSEDASGTRTSRGVSEPVTVEVVEPQLDITKEVNPAESNPASTGPFEGGSTVTYDITISNTGTSDAFEFTVLDTVDANLDLTNYTVLGPAYITTDADNSTTGVGGTVDLLLSELRVGDVVVVRVETTVLNTVEDNQTIDNTADITWTSLPGDGTDTPGASGDTDGERNGSGTGQNDYSNTDTTPVTIDGTFVLDKSITVTSESHTDDSSLPNTGASDVPVAVGEIVRYQLATTIPNLTVDNVLLTDQFSTGVVPILDDTFTLTTVADTGIDFTTYLAISGTVTDFALFDAGGTEQVPGLVNYDSVANFLSVDFGQVINRDDSTTGAADELIVLEFNVLVINESVTNLGDIFANDYDLEYDDASGTTQSQTSNVVSIEIAEPDISVAKTVNTTLSNPSGTTTFSAGDTVVYDVVLTNNGTSDAFEINVIDTLIAELNFETVANGVEVYDANNTLLVAGIGYTDNSVYTDPGEGADVILPVMSSTPGDATQEITVRLNTIVLSTVSIGDVLTNVVDGTYTSLPGDGTAGNPTGSETPGASGDDNGERNGDDGASGVDDYVFNDTVDIDITDEFILDKQITATSESHTDDSSLPNSGGSDVPVAVGEIVRYQLTTTVPDLTTDNVILTDQLSTGIVPILDDTFTLTTVADTGIDFTAYPAISGTVTDFALFDGTGVEQVPGLVNYNAGTNFLEFDFGQVVSNDGDAGNVEQIVVTFNVLVINSAVTNLGDIYANDYEGSFTDGNGTTQTMTPSNTVTVELVEPDISVNKTVNQTLSNPSGTTTFTAGDTVVYDVVLTNNGNADAFDINVIDILIAELNFETVANGVEVFDANNTLLVAGTGYTDNSVYTDPGEGANVILPVMSSTPGDATQEITVRLNTTVLNTVSVGDVLVNDVTGTYTSLPDGGTAGNPTGSDTPGASGDDDGERNGDDGAGGVDDYVFDDSVQAGVSGSFLLEKEITATSESHTDDSSLPNTGASDVPVAVGEVVRYQLTTTIPDLTTDDVILTDQLSDGVLPIFDDTFHLTMLSDTGIELPAHPGVPNTAADFDLYDAGGTAQTGIVNYNAATNFLEFNFGQVVSNDADSGDVEQIVIVFNVVVVNDAATNVGDIYANDYEGTFTDGSGATQDIGPSNTVSIELLEPNIGVTKTINDTLSIPSGTTVFQAGDTVVYDVVLTNSGNSDAFDINVIDILVGELNFINATNGVEVYDANNTLLVAGTGYTDNSTYTDPGEEANVIIPVMSSTPGDATNTITVRLTTIVQNTVTPGQVIDNIVNGTYTSLPDAGTTGNPTGSDTPGASGDEDGERNGDGGVNDYTFADNDTFTATDTFSITKTVAPTTATIGDTVTYTVTLELIEGTTTGVTLTDTFPADYEYVPGSLTLTPSTAGTTTGFTAGSETFTAPTLSINAGDVTIPADGDDTNNTLVFTYDALILNTANNNSGDVDTNTVEANSDTLGPVTDTSDVTLEEPGIAVTKTLVGAQTTPVQAGTLVDYELTVTNTGNTTAYDVLLTDTLANDGGSINYMEFDSTGAITCISTVNDTNAAGDNPVVYSIDSLPMGETCTIPYTAVITVAVSSGQTLPNTVEGRLDTQDEDGAAEEREYTDSDNATISTDVIGNVTKSILNTSLSETGTSEFDGATEDAAIGEIVTYQIVMSDVPQGTNQALVEDIMPQFVDVLEGRVVQMDGITSTLSVGDSSATSTAITITDLNADTQNDIAFDFGELVNTPDSDTETIILEVDVRVIDVAGNVNGDVLTNQVTLFYNSESYQDTEPVEIVEPDPVISKTFSPDEVLRGATTQMTLVVENNGNGPLYQIEVVDLLDVFLRYDGVTIDASSASLITAADVTTASGTVGGFGQMLGYVVQQELALLPGESLTFIVDLYVDETATVPVDILNEVTLTGESVPDDNLHDDSDGRDQSAIANDTLQVIIPELVVEKIDSADPVSPGQTFSYTVTVTHTGTALTESGTATTAPDATNVVFEDVLPADFNVSNVVTSQGTCSPISGGILTCALGTLAANGGAGSSVTITITGAFAPSVADGTVALNSATVSSDEGNTPDNDTPDDNDDERADEETTIERNTDVAITKTVNDPNPVQGDLLTYTLDVVNNGPSDATTVTVTDTLPAELTPVSFVPGTLPCSFTGQTLTCNFPALAAGDNVVIGIEATVNASASTATQPITNTAEVTIAETESNTDNNSDSADITVGGADLELTKTVDNATPAEGDTVVFSVTLQNIGPGPATTVVVSDLLPAGVTYVSDNAAALLDGDSNPTTYDNTTGDWSIGTLNAGTSLTLEISATVDSGTTGTSIVNVAEVTASDQTDPDSTPDNNDPAEDDQDDATIAVSGLDLAVVKTVTENTPNEGGAVTYFIEATNNGPANATGVEVVDDLNGLAGITYSSHTAPGGTTYNDATGIWTIGGLNAGQTLTLQITVTVDPGTAGQTIVNTTTISSDQPDSNPDNNDDDATITVNTVDLGVTKVVDNNTPSEGDTVTFTITLENFGPGDANNIIVTDLLPAGLIYAADNSTALLDDNNNPTSYDSATGEWSIGFLANGSTIALELAATVDTGTAGTSITNTATRTSNDEGDDNPDNDSDDATIAVSGLDLALEKTVDNPNPVEGDTITYSLTVTNNGPTQATGVEITDDLNALPVTYVSDNSAAILDDTGTATAYAPATGIWTVGTMNSGTSFTLEITVTVNAGTAGTTVTNAATISNVDQPDSNPDNNDDTADITVEGLDLSVDKVVDNPTPTQGDTITYTVTVTNNGPGDATGVQLEENLSMDGVNFTYVSDTPSQGTFTVNNPPPSIWDVGALASGESATLELSVIVERSSGTVVNTVTISNVDQPDSNPDNDQDDATITLGGVDLAVNKVVDIPNPATGDTIIYTIEVENVGAGQATGVTVLDILPAGVSYISDDAATVQDDTATPTSYDPATGNWAIGVMNPGTLLTLNLTVEVTASDGIITNTATVSANEPDANPDNDEDDAQIALNAADLRLEKTRTIAGAFIGDPVQYEIVLTNDGPNTATNVAVTDDFPASLAFTSYTASQGTYDDATGIWTVGTLPNGASVTLTLNATIESLGSQVNTAEVTASDQPDPDSTPDNDDPAEDDQDSSDSSSIFDPPFGVKTFDDNGLPVLRWTMVWVNPGTVPVDATVTDVLQPGTSFVPGSLTCSGPGLLDTVECEYQPGLNRIFWRGTVYPDPGVTNVDDAQNPLIISFLVRVDDGVFNVSNTGTLTTGGDNSSSSNATSVWEIEPPIVPGPGQGDALITKTVDPAFGAVAGDTVTWTITVENPTSTPLTNTVVTDTVPDSLDILGTNSSIGSVTINGQSLTWNIGTLNPGEVVTLTLNTIIRSDTTESVIINTALLDADGLDTRSATATLIGVTELPATGETPLWATLFRNWLPVLALIAGTLLLSGGWWFRRRHPAHAER